MARFTAAAAEDIPAGTMRRVEIGGRVIAVAHLDDDGFQAFEDLCSHAEASLAEGRLCGVEVECPLHGARFDTRTGQPLTLPAVAPVATFPVSVEDGIIYVEIDD